jgi:hypothetical protein
VIRAFLALAAAALALPLAASAAGDPKAPQQRHTAADTKRAAAIVLRRSDLAAGWKADPPAKADPPCSASPDESKIVQTAKVDPSFTYKDGVTNVGSEVDVFRSVAEERQDWRASGISLFETCLLQSARAGAGKKVHVTMISARKLAPPKAGERSLHYRFVFSLRSVQTASLVVDLVAIARGRVSVVLHTLTVRWALPASVLDTLTGVLAARLDAGRGITA